MNPRDFELHGPGFSRILPSMTENVLSDVFRVLEVNEAHYGHFESRGPWTVSLQAQELVRVYAVLQGECLLEIRGAEPVLLQAGDVAALLTPTAHELRSPGGAPRRVSEAAFDAGTKGSLDPLHDVALERAPGAFRIVSGRIHCLEAHDSFWWKLVPPLLTMHQRAHVLPWVEATLHFIVEEVQASRPGSQTLARRLTELLFVQLVSAQLQKQEAGEAGWLTALADPQIGKALSLLHSEPEKPWTVQELGRKLGMSRSAFANHFVSLVGEPPMQYLTRVRMERAASLLRDGWAATGEVANSVGYVSDASFCKAFKRAFGQSPGAYRRAWRNSAGAPEALLPEEAA